jgi:hypothetical protein
VAISRALPRGMAISNISEGIIALSDEISEQIVCDSWPYRVRGPEKVFVNHFVGILSLIEWRDWHQQKKSILKPFPRMSMSEYCICYAQSFIEFHIALDIPGSIRWNKRLSAVCYLFCVLAQNWWPMANGPFPLYDPRPLPGCYVLHQPPIGSQAHLPCCLEIYKSIVQYSAKLARMSLTFWFTSLISTDTIGWWALDSMSSHHCFRVS